MRTLKINVDVKVYGPVSMFWRHLTLAFSRVRVGRRRATWTLYLAGRWPWS